MVCYSGYAKEDCKGNVLISEKEECKMKRVFIKFDKTEQVAKFVRIMNHYDFEAYVKSGTRQVDARSIVGVLALAKAKTVELILHTTDNCEELMEEIAPFAA